ncbi:HTTM domain-containing protein [Bdellovibrio reynosensis]|uniref:HTTM domain-containing protein n=1 Tax=Bdellovibrio reynosensis TaxID=2835041 RepID=A0ABY4CBI3_9BACT|nr:HTTM domain-containing protein [Bdellovibrio reynosensis]UOF01247.1 HTTM domain-containing protein [Bdellovibrio reynosensis]
MKLKTITKSVNDFFFLPQPIHSVALLRIGLGIILLLNWFSIWKHLEFFWGVDAIVSLETAVKMGNPLRFNIFELLPNDPKIVALIAVIHLVGIVGMTLGLYTRTSIVLAFFTLVSFHSRNHFILNSADVVMRNFLFLLFFSPSGEIFSVDAWLNRKKEKSLECSPWALRLMQIQFSIIYISTVMFKMKGNLWADGTAIYIATRLDEFVRVPLSILNSILVIKLLTWSTLVVEFALGTLIWIKELRYWVLLAGLGLHLGIEITMHIPLFEWIMIVTMIVMVDSRDIQKVIEAARIYRMKWNRPAQA